MAQAMVNFRMDADLKKNMEITCKNMGLSLSAAFILFATKVTKEQRIPFEITADPFYSAENLARLKEAVDDIKAGRNLTEHELVEVK